MSVLERLLGSKHLAELYRRIDNPESIQQLLDAKGKPYADSTIRSYKSKLHTRGIVDHEGYFTGNFYKILQTDSIQVKGSRARINRYINEAEIKDNVYVEDNMELKDIFNILEKKVDIQFMYPPNKKIHDINFDETKIQYVRLNNLSHYVRYPEYVKYVSVCPICGAEEIMREDKAARCDVCKTKGKIKYDLSLSRGCFVYMIDYQQEQYVARSLSILPLGDFNAAVIIVKDKKAYTFFIIATANPDRPKVGLKFEDGDRLQQLVKKIDGICDERIDKSIYGMTYYKYAILLSYLAALAKMTGYNIYICGVGGIGKTSTARLYTATITEKTKCQDSTNISSGGGIRGTTQNMSIDGKLYTVHEPGILERYNIVILDELLEMGGEKDDKSFLKSSLSSSTLTVEVAGNRTEITKNATVVGTSNIPKWVKVKRAKMIGKGLSPDVEFASQGLWYVDGQNIHFLDRFALLFYIDESEVKPDFNTNDQIISDVDLRQMLYTPEIDNYLKLCSQIKVKLPENIIKQLEEISTSSYDPIHSTSRRDSFISMTVQLHAMINNRDVANMDDVRFVRQILHKCFHKITVNMLTEEYEDIIQPLDIWALKTTLATLKVASKEQLRKQCSKTYCIFSFNDIFEQARHYNEIIEVDKGKYRCAGAFD